MAKKPTAPRRRKASTARGTTPPRSRKAATSRNVFLALGILVLLAVFGAVAVRLFLPPRPALPVAAAPKPQPPVAPKAPVRPRPETVRPRAAASVPTYEIFPSREAPPQPIPPPTELPSGRPRVALVIDDLGYDLPMAEAFFNLNVPLTAAVLPFSPHKNEVVAAARRHGRPVMLHLPMEPEEYPRVDPGPGALLTSMSPDELLAQLREDLQDVPTAIGVNNHMGSRLTQDADRLNQVFSVLRERGLFFIDSRTTDKTRGYQSARLLNVPFAQRDVFLDHRQEPEFIRRQIEVLIRRAEENGQAVGIGHPHPVTLEVLREQLPQMRRRVDLVPASSLVRAHF
jgi:polysaccharide deacetylase 2 family uncharacterized protein YibQ